MTIPSTRSITQKSFGLLAVGLLGLETLTAVETLDFSGGGSLEAPNLNAVDSFPGKQGGGWSNAWQISQKPRRHIFNAFVSEKIPFPESGKPSYLQMQLESLATPTSSLAGVNRSYEIDQSKPHKISFSFRLDELSEEFSTERDSVVFNGGSRSTSEEEEGINLAWQIFFRPNLGWMANRGQEESPLRIVPKDSLLQKDTVWKVEITIDPSALVYHVQLKDANGQEWKLNDIPLISEKKAIIDSVGFYIARVGEGKSVSWAISNIQVTSLN